MEVSLFSTSKALMNLSIPSFQLEDSEMNDRHHDSPSHLSRGILHTLGPKKPLVLKATVGYVRTLPSNSIILSRF